MTYKELYEKALWDLEHSRINLGEFEDMIEPLNKEIPKEEQTAGDLISRQAVNKLRKYNLVGGVHTVSLDDINKLPSVRGYGDLISRTDLLNAIWQKEYGKDYDGVNLLNIKHIDIIEQMPSAEKMAEWIFKTTKSAKCSNCGYVQFTNGEDMTKNVFIHKSIYHYCPNCGAKMQESEEEE